MVKRTGILALLFLPLLCHAGAAYGANTSSPGDPSAGSPAGAVYQLPFEEGRSDGAPKGSGGTGAPGPGGGGGGSGTGTSGGGESGEPSSYRSENNFGSSSQVPGVGADGAGGSKGGGAGSGKGAADEGGAAGSGGSDPNSSLGAAELTDSGNTSPAANIGLLLLIVAVAGGVGYVTLRSHRLKEPR